MAQTSVVRKIAINPTAETSCPSVVAPGSNVDWTASALSTWITIGSVNDLSDDVDIGEDAVNFAFPNDRDVEIKPPGSFTTEEWIQRGGAPSEVPFNCYDASQSLLDLDSKFSTTDDVTTVSTSLTYRSMVVEVQGKFLEYLPKVKLTVTESSGAYGEPVLTSVTASVCTTSSVPAGWQRHFFTS